MSHVAIPLFDGESYDLWAVRMQTYLEGLDLWEVVEEDDVPPYNISHISLISLILSKALKIPTYI